MADELNKFNNKINKLDSAITKRLRTKLLSWGKRIRKEIQDRTKDGKGVHKKRSEAVPFKPLAESTIEHRRLLKERGELNSETSPGKSNQMESGKLINDMQLKIDSPTLTIEISPSTDRKDVAKGQQDMGRTIFNLSEEQFREIEQDIKDEVLDVIKKSLK